MKSGQEQSGLGRKNSGSAAETGQVDNKACVDSVVLWGNGFVLVLRSAKVKCTA